MSSNKSVTPSNVWSNIGNKSKHKQCQSKPFDVTGYALNRMNDNKKIQKSIKNKSIDKFDSVQSDITSSNAMIDNDTLAKFLNRDPNNLENMIDCDRGTFTFLYGPSGCGKRTLVKKILNIYKDKFSHTGKGIKVFLFTKHSDWIEAYKDIIPHSNMTIKPQCQHFLRLNESLKNEELKKINEGTLNKTILIFDEYDYINMKKNNSYMAELINSYRRRNLDIIICSTSAQLNSFYIDSLDYLIIFGTKNNSEVQRIYDKYIDSLYLTFGKFKFIVSTLKNYDFLIYNYTQPRANYRHKVHPAIDINEEYSILGTKLNLNDIPFDFCPKIFENKQRDYEINDNESSSIKPFNFMIGSPVAISDITSKRIKTPQFDKDKYGRPTNTDPSQFHVNDKTKFESKEMQNTETLLSKQSKTLENQELKPIQRSGNGTNIININFSDSIMNAIVKDHLEITLSVKPK